MAKTEKTEKTEKTKKRQEASAEYAQPPGKIYVRICGRKNGLEEYRNVHFVRLVSKQYNLLIMADYLPLIGDLEGAVFFRTGEKEYAREHVKGCFMHKNNEFSLLLEEEHE